MVFTLGAKGCVGCSPEEGYFEVPSFDVPVADTVGAGDVFHGAYVVGLLRGLSPKEAARLATGVSCIKCTRIGGPGGHPGLGHRAEVLADRRDRLHRDRPACGILREEIAAMRKQHIVLGVAPTKRSF